jgi:hypothetical protein
MAWGLKAAVGLTDAGTQCPNFGGDQQQVVELLDAIGLPAGGISIDSLPPVEEGHASPQLCEAIRTFQLVQGLGADARVDVNGATWQRLIGLAQPGGFVIGGVPLLLVSSSFEVTELPASASGLPSLTYTLKGPVATWEGPGVRVELSVQGPIKVDWAAAFPAACAVSPDFFALQASVASGVARNIGGQALDALCSKVKLESRAAIGNMFAAVSLQLDANQTPVLGGSIGDSTSFQSVAWDPVARAVIYRATKSVLRFEPVTGGTAKLTGSIAMELKFTATQEQFQASVVAALVVAVAAGVVLWPVAEFLASGEVAAGAGSVVRQVLIRLTPLLAP